MIITNGASGANEARSIKPDYAKTFVAAGKAVYEAEYELEPGEFCAAAEALDFSAVRKGLELFAKPFEPCDPVKEN